VVFVADFDVDVVSGCDPEILGSGCDWSVFQYSMFSTGSKKDDWIDA
jgi:hypothetical protein